MKTIFLFIAIAFSVALNAQVTKINLKASGLTCSMCSNSINKALKTLTFVDAINADIKTYTFEITFKTSSAIDFDKIKKKVEDAGFSVAAFTALINFNNVQVKDNKPLTIGNMTFLFVRTKEQLLNGIKDIKVLNKGFITPKEYKVIGLPAASPGIYQISI